MNRRELLGYFSVAGIGALAEGLLPGVGDKEADPKTARKDSDPLVRIDHCTQHACGSNFADGTPTCADLSLCWVETCTDGFSCTQQHQCHDSFQCLGPMGCMGTYNFIPDGSPMAATDLTQAKMRRGLASVLDQIDSADKDTTG